MPTTKSKKSKNHENNLKDAVVKKLTEMLGKAHLELVDHQVENYKLTRLIERKERENQFLREIVMDHCTKKQYENFEVRRKRMRILDDSDEDEKALK